MWLRLNNRCCLLVILITFALRCSFRTALNRNLLEFFGSFSLLSGPGRLFRLFTRNLENDLLEVLVSISATNRITNILIKRPLTIRPNKVFLYQGLAVVGLEIVVDFLLQVSLRPLKCVLVLLDLLLEQNSWLALLTQLLEYFLGVSLLVYVLRNDLERLIAAINVLTWYSLVV